MVPEGSDGGRISEGEEAELLARHGIERFPAHQFRVGGYRYGNLADAVAQARRMEGSGR